MATIEAKRVLGLVGGNLLLGAQGLRFIITAGRRLALSARDEVLSFAVSSPSGYAGSYVLLPTTVASGPVALTLPAIEGTPTVGQTLSVRPALWVHDGARPDPVQSWQWRRDGVDIAGATGIDYAVAAADAGKQIEVVETLAAETGDKTLATAPVAIVP